jgi:triphosphoribosyl-dephospho-CoA synthetase
MSNKIDKLISTFAENVIKQEECMKEGDYKNGNKYAKKYINSWKKIAEIGDEAKEKMTELMNHSVDSVRSMAATFLLEYKTNLAIRVLKEISKRNDSIGFGAKEVLNRWEKEGYGIR